MSAEKKPGRICRANIHNPFLLFIFCRSSLFTLEVGMLICVPLVINRFFDVLVVVFVRTFVVCLRISQSTFRIFLDKLFRKNRSYTNDFLPQK